MASASLPIPLNVQGNPSDESPRPRFAIVRDIEQTLADMELSERAHRLEIAEINRTIDQLDAEIDHLVRAGQDLDRHRDNYILSLRGHLDLGPPSLPLEVSLDGDVPAPLSGAGTKFVDQLPDINLSDLPNDSHSCNICMEPFGSTDEPESPVQLPCGHVMGRNCISTWLATSNSCPLCRCVLFGHEAWDPPLTATELMDLLEATHPPTEVEIRDLLETTRPETDTNLSNLLEMAGLGIEDAESFRVEFEEITRRQATIETRLAHLEEQDSPSTPLRVAEVRELMEENEELHARLGSFRVRHSEMIEIHGIQLPSVGRLFRGS